METLSICKVLRIKKIKKDLGIIFQNKFKFGMHISDTIIKANRILNLVKRTSSYLDKESFLCSYKSLLRSHVD